MEIQTSAQIAIKEAMTITGCRTHGEIAERVGVSQNAIWKLVNGKSRTTKYQTAVAFEKVTNGLVSRLRFLEEQENPNGKECPPRSGNASTVAQMEGGAVAQSSAEKSAQY